MLVISYWLAWALKPLVVLVWCIVTADAIIHALLRPGPFPELQQG